MAGGGMGGVSSTGYGQQSAQPNFGSNIDPNNIDPNHIFTDDFGRNNAAPTSTIDLNGMRNLLGGMSRTTGQSPFTADAKPNPFLSTPANQNSQPTSPIFNAQYYLQQNPDVAANETFGKNPYQHYLQYGQSEGRSAYDASNPLRFDPNFYLEQNSDVAKAGVDPLQHYIQFGQMEGRAGYNTAAPAVQQQYSQAYTPTTTSWTSAAAQPVTFNAPTVSQSGDTGGAMNYKYRRGGIASLLRR